MRRRIIFLDIDGTLTEAGKNEPPQSALWAIEQARKAGHFVFLCTGRNYDMLSPLLQYGFDGVIGSAGGYIECRGEVLYDCPMTRRQTELVMTVLAGNGVFRTVECMEGAFTDEGFKEFLQEHAAEGRNSELLRWREQIEQSLHILPMREYRGQPVYKVVFMSSSMEALARPQEALREEFDFCIHGEDPYGFINGEIINRQFDKGKAVEKVCMHLGIPVADAIAFGDSINDRQMLETAGLGICMANGSEQLKELADEICPAVWEDGIQTALEKYCLTASSVSLFPDAGMKEAER